MTVTWQDGGVDGSQADYWTLQQRIMQLIQTGEENMIRLFKVRSLETYVDHDYGVTPTRKTPYTDVTLDGIGKHENDTLRLRVPFTDGLRLGQEMEVNCHIEELLHAAQTPPPVLPIPINVHAEAEAIANGPAGEPDDIQF